MSISFLQVLLQGLSYPAATRLGLSRFYKWAKREQARRASCLHRLSASCQRSRCLRRQCHQVCRSLNIQTTKVQLGCPSIATFLWIQAYINRLCRIPVYRPFLHLKGTTCPERLANHLQSPKQWIKSAKSFLMPKSYKIKTSVYENLQAKCARRSNETEVLPILIEPLTCFLIFNILRKNSSLEGMKLKTYSCRGRLSTKNPAGR